MMKSTQTNCLTALVVTTSTRLATLRMSRPLKRQRMRVTYLQA
jgi:hypothetical protein